MTYDLRRSLSPYKPLEHMILLILIFTAVFFRGLSCIEKEEGSRIIAISAIPLFLGIMSGIDYWFNNDEIERRNKNRIEALKVLEKNF